MRRERQKSLLFKNNVNSFQIDIETLISDKISASVRPKQLYSEYGLVGQKLYIVNIVHPRPRTNPFKFELRPLKLYKTPFKKN